MPEIIPSHRIKIIPWPEEEGLVVFKRTRKQILFIGLNKYLHEIKGKKPVDNSAKRPGDPVY